MLEAILLVLLSLGFVLAEVFFPSLGMFGLIAGALILFADIIAFDHGQATGWAFVAAEVVLVPWVVWMGFKLLPKLPFGRRMLLEGPVTPPDGGLPDHAALQGQTGVALTDLRPAGMARLGDERLSVVSLGGLIDENTPIIVVAVEGTEIRVRPHDVERTDDALAATADEDPA